MEDYLGINPDGTLQPVPTPPESDTYDDDVSIVDTEAPSLFEPFKDLCKRRFLWYYDSYLASITIEREKVAEGTPFVRMPFEHSGNAMEGKFLYSELERRLKFVKERLDHETASWAAEGKEMQGKESGVAANLQRQFEQTVEHYKTSQSVTIDIELVDGNPFLWRVVSYDSVVGKSELRREPQILTYCRHISEDR
jgi:ubiquitin-conjugating enzyme E2 Z